MRNSGYFYPAELALFGYLVLTGFAIGLHYSLVPHSVGRIAFRVAVIMLVITMAWMEHKRVFLRAVTFARFVLPLLLLTYLYTETDALNNFIFRENLDPFFSRLEEFFFGFQPALVFAEWLPSNGFAEAMYFGYFSYYLMLALVPLYLFFRSSRERAFRALFTVVHSFFIFYLVFILFPAGGPQFYFTDLPELPRGYLFGEAMRFIQAWAEAPTAAFPSSHVSICLLLILLSYKYARTLVKFILPVSILLVFSTVYLRAHYLIDILAAFMITPFLYLFSGFVFDRIYKQP